MDQYRQKKIEKALKTIAKKEGITINEVRDEIAYAVSIALKSSDKNVQQFWQSIPCEGASPTIEEIIDFLAEKIASEE